MKCHLDLSWFPICDFNYETLFWQHVKTPELSKAQLTYHTRATSVLCTELIPKEAIASGELQGSNSLAKAGHGSSWAWKPDHWLVVHTIVPIVSIRSSFLQMLLARDLLPDSSRIHLIKITTAFLFQKPRFILFYFNSSIFLSSLTWKTMLVSQHILCLNISLSFWSNLTLI